MKVRLMAGSYMKLKAKRADFILDLNLRKISFQTRISEIFYIRPEFEQTWANFYFKIDFG